MITALVKLLLSVPSLFEVFLKIRDEIETEIVRRAHSDNSKRIDEWVRDGKDKPSS